MKPYYLAATFIAIAAITVTLGAVLVFTSSKKSEINKTYIQAKPTIVKPAASPVPVPLVESEADKTFVSTDEDIQTTLNQASHDLNDLDAIDQSRDNTSL